MITSKDNELVKEVARLMTSPKSRRELGCFAAEGVRLCVDGAVSGAVIRSFFYTEDAMEKYPREFETIREVSPKSFAVSGKVFGKMADTTTPQGFLCVFEKLDKNGNLFKIVRKGRYAALENIQDPSNLGTILRSAEALGIDGMILSEDCCDIYSPKVVRGSMGAVFRVPVQIVKDLTAYIAGLTQQGILTYASTPHEADDINDIDFSEGGIMLIGNEGNGLRPETIRACSRSVRIAMRGRAESLNASAAAAILLYRLQG